MDNNRTITCLSEDLVSAINRLDFVSLLQDKKNLYISLKTKLGHQLVTWSVSDITSDKKFADLIEKKIAELTMQSAPDEVIELLLRLEGTCSRVLLRLEVDEYTNQTKSHKTLRGTLMNDDKEEAHPSNLVAPPMLSDIMLAAIEKSEIMYIYQDQGITNLHFTDCDYTATFLDVKNDRDFLRRLEDAAARFDYERYAKTTGVSDFRALLIQETYVHAADECKSAYIDVLEEKLGIREAEAAALEYKYPDLLTPAKTSFYSDDGRRTDINYYTDLRLKDVLLACSDEFFKYALAAAETHEATENVESYQLFMESEKARYQEEQPQHVDVTTAIVNMNYELLDRREVLAQAQHMERVYLDNLLRRLEYIGIDTSNCEGYLARMADNLRIFFPNYQSFSETIGFRSILDEDAYIAIAITGVEPPKKEEKLNVSLDELSRQAQKL